MSDTYYVVGIHGAPTKETAPHGYMWRNRHTPESKGKWVGPTNVINIAHSDTEWYPLPPPPTEQAPAPEPVERWAYCRDYDNVTALRLSACPAITDHHEAARYRDALNALDRDGVAWGPGRPMEELPETGRVLAQTRGGGTSIVWAEDIQNPAPGLYLGWWPLPLPGEAQ